MATGAGAELTVGAGAAVGGTMPSGSVGSIQGGMVVVLLANTTRSPAILEALPLDNFDTVVGRAIVVTAPINDVICRRQG